MKAESFMLWTNEMPYDDGIGIEMKNKHIIEYNTYT